MSLFPVWFTIKAESLPEFLIETELVIYILVSICVIEPSALKLPEIITSPETLKFPVVDTPQLSTHILWVLLVIICNGWFVKLPITTLFGVLKVSTNNLPSIV